MCSSHLIPSQNDPVSIYTWIMRSHLSIITAVQWNNPKGPGRLSCPVQGHTSCTDASRTLCVREIYRPHSARVKLHLLNWNIPPSVIQYGLCSCLWLARWCYNIWQKWIMAVCVCDKPRVPCFCMAWQHPKINAVTYCTVSTVIEPRGADLSQHSPRPGIHILTNYMC